MRVRSSRCSALFAAAFGLVPVVLVSAGELDLRSTQLLELSGAYGNSHFIASQQLVGDLAGRPQIPDYTLPYAVALLELNWMLPRARSVISTVVAWQDTNQDSETAGLFTWYGVSGAPYSAAATARVVPLLIWAYEHHKERLGPDLAQQVANALRLARQALLQRLDDVDNLDDQLQMMAAVALAQRALQDDTGTDRISALVAQWEQEISDVGRLWGPSPTTDALRLVALQRLYSALPKSARDGAEALLRLCYLDFAQRVHPALSIVSGAAASASVGEYSPRYSEAACLIYRDFGGSIDRHVHPFAASVALTDYRPGEELVDLVEDRPEAYSIQTSTSQQGVPQSTYTYMDEKFTLGTMTGSCSLQAAPVVATFPQAEKNATAHFRVHGAEGHCRSLQCGNFAICSFDFDMIGIGDRTRAWVTGLLGGAEQIEEVYLLGQKWDDEPAAIGALWPVIIKRNGVYIILTLLQSGAVDKDTTHRRKPGVLQWTGERTQLTLSTYARHPDYQLRRPQNDLRAGFVIQIWDAEAFEKTEDVYRWLRQSRINQRYEQRTEKTPQPRDTHPVLDEHKPKPRQRYTKRLQKVHTIEYSYLRGRGDRFTLVEDLKHEEVLSRTCNGQALDRSLWWQGPAFSLSKGQKLEDAVLPAAAEPQQPQG